MATNNGFLMIAGLGALMLLGRGGSAGTSDEDNRLVMGQSRSGPIPPAFDLQSYIDGLFSETATVPQQPPMTFFYPRDHVVTSSGVPGMSEAAPELITSTTKVQIGGDGGETIEASALAVLRSEQLARQRFDAAANVFSPPPGETAAANRAEEARQRQFARDLIAKNIAAQSARTRADQERLANPGSAAGQDIWISGHDEFADPDFVQESYVPTPQYSETFVISGGMDSPGFASEDEQPSVITVQELTAVYDIGF